MIDKEINELAIKLYVLTNPGVNQKKKYNKWYALHKTLKKHIRYEFDWEELNRLRYENIIKDIGFIEGVYELEDNGIYINTYYDNFKFDGQYTIKLSCDYNTKVVSSYNFEFDEDTNLLGRIQKYLKKVKHPLLYKYSYSLIDCN